MTDRNAQILRCCWPGCHNTIWVEKNLEVCGGHARAVLDRMMGEARKRIEATHGSAGPIERERDRLRDENARLRATVDRMTQAPTRPAPVDGTVYVLRCGGFIKIGWTSDLTKRMRSYQPDSVLLATMPGTRKDENRLHKRFAHLRTHGREWYPIAPQITEYVERLVREHGQPEQVTFAAKPTSIRRTTPQPVGQASTRRVWAV